MKYLRALHEMGGDPDVFRFTASTPGVKRDGIDLAQTRWQLENYQRNPVVLWAHDYIGQHLPIGRAEVIAEEGRLIADVTFDAEDPFAQSIRRKYEKGFLNAVSVGWNTIRKQGEGEFYELLDVSAVPVPGNPDALMERQRAGLRAMRSEIDDILSDEPSKPSSDAVWAGVGSAMLALFRDHTAIEDEDRRAVYNALERAYRKLGKTPPEFMPSGDLENLTESQIDGLFLEGETPPKPEPLPQSERDAVRTAVNVLLQNVISNDAPEVREPESENEAAQLKQFSEWLEERL